MKPYEREVRTADLPFFSFATAFSTRETHVRAAFAHLFWNFQAELWVNPGPGGGVAPRQRARARMLVSDSCLLRGAAMWTSARSGQGRERIEEDACGRAYAAYGLDGTE